MTYNEIVSLMDRGFTAEQIMQLNAAPATPADPEPAPADPATPADPEPAPADPATPAAPAATPADPEPAPAAPAATPADPLHELMTVIKGMSSEISALKAAQQNSNIKNVIRESAADTQSADDILAGFINPPYDEKNGGKTK